MGLSDFDSLSPKDKIRLFAWYLHDQGSDAFDNAAIRDCFRQLHLVPPDASVYLPRMAAAKPPDLIKVRGGYKLVGTLRKKLDAKYGRHPTAVLVTDTLANLVTKILSEGSRVFLAEALDCYRVGAFRSTIVMTWNLAFDHLEKWILSDGVRLAAFNDAIKKRYPKRSGHTVKRLEDFEEFSESEVVEVVRTANLVSHNVIEILRQKLKRRNMAAHPSQVVVTQAQADDVVTDLVNNVVLSLT